MKLQVNTKGSWRDVIEFDPGDTRRIERAAQQLAAVTGTSVGWRYLTNFGDAYYLAPGTSRWETLAQRRGEEEEPA